MSLLVKVPTNEFISESPNVCSINYLPSHAIFDFSLTFIRSILSVEFQHDKKILLSKLPMKFYIQLETNFLHISFLHDA